MKFRTRLRFVFSFLCLVMWLATSHSVVLGARVAGEDGVTPIVPKAKERAQGPDPGAAPEKSPGRGKTAQDKKKAVREKMLEKRRQKIRQKMRQEKPQEGREEARNEKAADERKKIPELPKPDERFVTIDFDDVDIEIFIKFMSELTGKNFVIDKGVKGKITIVSPTKISVDEAYKVFESVLEVHGYTPVPAGKITKIVPAVQARSKDVETRLQTEGITAEDKVVTQLIPLKYADPDELKKIFAPLISKSSVIVSYAPTGMLIVTDVLSNIKRLIRITEVIDVEGIGEEISVLPLEHGTASIMEKTLTTLFQKMARRPGKKGAAGTSDVKIVSDERTNVLIILASENDTRKIKELVKLLDKETPPGEGDVRVYYLQNANAEDLTKVLMAIPPKQAKTAQKGKAPVISKEVQIVADKATNSLVITSDKDDYLVLEDVIKKLDIPRRMVYIEALIMDVGVDKEFDLGVQWQAIEDTGSHEGRKIYSFGGSSLGDSKLPSLDPQAGAIALAKGISLGVMGEGITIGDVKFTSIAAVIQAYQSHSDVNILSTPQIMTTDNEEAEIYIGENRPFLTRQERTVGSLDYSNYEFKDVGVTLTITPQINQERFVRLKLSQEVSQVLSESTVGLPVTQKRLAKTTVIVKDGNTVVIGGLIDESMNETIYEVPCLGNVPGLGWLFKSLSRASGKTNLYIFLTPHIIENPEEAQDVYQKKKSEIDRIQEGVIKMYQAPLDALPESEKTLTH